MKITNLIVTTLLATTLNAQAGTQANDRKNNIKVEVLKNATMPQTDYAAAMIAKNIPTLDKGWKVKISIANDSCIIALVFFCPIISWFTLQDQKNILNDS